MTFVGLEPEGRGEDQDWLLPEYSPFNGYLDNAVAVFMPVVLLVILFFFIFCYSMIANQRERYSFFYEQYWGDFHSTKIPI